MRELLLFATLLGPLGCSETSPKPTTPKSTECAILRLAPPPKLHAANCESDLGTQVCLTREATVALAVWIADVEETRHGLEGCPLVRLVDE